MEFQQITQLSDLSSRPRAVVAVGIFDGVHRGHQTLLQQVIEDAHRHNAIPAVYTFYPHPREIIRGIPDRFYLESLDSRVKRLKDAGIQLVITQPFTQETRKQRASQFIEELQKAVDLQTLWGGNFSIGYRREGTFEYLTQLGLQKGFDVQLADGVQVDNKRVSSSRIRVALANGLIKEVTSCLGRPYAVCGEVIQGKQLGRTINFPTANLNIWEKQALPDKGVYATRCWVDGVPYLSATNIGIRPTIEGDSALSVEAHLLDFSADMYGKMVRLEFLAFIRPEQKFSGLDALKEQIGRDVESVRMYKE